VTRLTGLAGVAANKFAQAAEVYSQAIAKNPSVPAYYSNRALAYLKTESYGYALADATKAIELDPGFVKVVAVARGCGFPYCLTAPARSSRSQAYYRRASASMALLRFKDAQRDLRTVRHRATSRSPRGPR
jgi:serine/threonine-protein phosphatase 5